MPVSTPHGHTSALLRAGPTLTRSERETLRALATIHVATARQISRLVFADHAPEVAARLARQNLLQLQRFSLTRRLPNPSRAPERHGGRPGYLHVLTDAGLRLHHGGSYAPGRRQRRSWHPGAQFINHRLAISELYVRLVEQARAGGPRVEEFRAEPDCWRRYHGPAGEQLTLKPDALVRLATGPVELSWFVEVDLGTESPRRIADKCHAYRAYELSGVEQQRFDIFPIVIFIVPNRERAVVIGRVIQAQPPDALGLFAVATDAEALATLATPAD